MQLLELVLQDPFVLSVSVAPPDPTVGSVQMVVGVCDADTLVPVPDARVDLVPVNPDGKAGAPIHALSRNENPEEYAAFLTVRQAGHWVYRVSVSSAAGSTALETGLDIRPAPGFNQDSSWIFFAINGALALGVGYVIWQVKRKQRRPQPEEAPAARA